MRVLKAEYFSALLKNLPVGSSSSSFWSSLSISHGVLAEEKGVSVITPLGKNGYSLQSRPAHFSPVTSLEVENTSLLRVFNDGTDAAWQAVVNVSLYQAAAAMSANARWQEAISENLASTSIPGFKKQDLSFDAVQSGVMSQATPDGRVRFTIPHASSATNFSQGQIRPTGVNTDVAIEGKGFFQIQMPNGATAYTRDGEFHINSSGQLTTKLGHLVIGDSGPIQMDQNLGGTISISPTGEVSQGSDIRGKLKVVDFAQPNLLTQISGGYFLANNPSLQAVDAPGSYLRQGFLEAANISPVTEMASLITVMRSFESNQRVMQMNDERMGRAISELGSPT